MAPQATTERSVTGIIADLLTQFTNLVRTESELARTEISEKISQIGAGIGMLVVGAVLLMPALVILLQAAVTALGQIGLARYWCEVAIGGAVFLIGLLLLLIGVSRLKARRLVPNKTIHQLQKDATAMQRQARIDHDHKHAA
ncbi:MAG TPA: phage holin family protein [Pseudolabrys sp.]|nr:phage holin family protein [Pseudolabrys sp.]